MKIIESVMAMKNGKENVKNGVNEIKAKYNNNNEIMSM
jgi:hypothetical protein